MTGDSIHGRLPPVKIKSCRVEESEFPNNSNPDDHLRVLLDKIVANNKDTVEKRSLGKSADGEYDIWLYDFRPTNYTNTILLTTCLHGNEKTPFYAYNRLFELMFEGRITQLNYIRKNIRILYVPIVNPWGFANNKRQNVNGVDLNRNFPYNWEEYEAGPESTNYKGESPLSENESRIIVDLAEEYKDELTVHIDAHTQISQKAEYILYYPRESKQNNNRMNQMIRSLKKEEELYTSGASVLPGLNNYLTLEHGLSGYLPEFYNGLSGEFIGTEEMSRAFKFFGNVLTTASYNYLKSNSYTINEKQVIHHSYSSHNTDKPLQFISDITDYSNALMFNLEFDVPKNSVFKSEGIAIIELEEESEFGIRPMFYQSYGNFFSKTNMEKIDMSATKLKLPAGIHTIPYQTIAYLQTENSYEDGKNRPGKASYRLGFFKGSGKLIVWDVKQTITIEAANSEHSLEVYKSTERGNQGKETFEHIF